MTNEQIENKMTESANEIGAIVLDFEKRKNDNIIYDVLCERHNGFNNEYVVWIYNTEIDGFANGYYTMVWKNAVEKFNERKR